jgi:Cu-Zn family superoxide dismutase
MNRREAILAGGAAGLALTGTVQAKESKSFEGVDKLVAVMRPTKGNTCSGVIEFFKEGSNVRIHAHFEGLKPNAKHAFHIHEFGDATSADGTSAGGHYNPGGHDHGRPDSSKRHAGDLGNLEADSDGAAHYERTDEHISLAGDKNPIIGRGVIVHEGEDKFTQPTGAAGARIGIGVIGVANPAAAAID